jgi:Ca2+/H+ antiporter, TMEM165/GDT1 family
VPGDLPVDFTVVALTFAAIFVVELPDKTFLATLVLSTKYRPVYVWIGVGLAFLVQVTVAVLFGQAVSLLPPEFVRTVAALMFLLGAVLLFRTARTSGVLEAGELGPDSEATLSAPSPLRIITTSFLVLFAAEWGDLSQILTLTLAARYDAPLSVFLGSWGALLAVSALATLVGKALLQRMTLSTLHYVGASVCLLLAALTAYELLS